MAPKGQQKSQPKERLKKGSFSYSSNPLQDDEFEARTCSSKLQMTKPHTPSHHIILLPDDENPAVNEKNQSISLDHARTRLVLKNELHLAQLWSFHFLDKLYQHPQHHRKLANVPACHVIGLFNGDLIIDAISKKRPGTMHYTFNRTTKMLQKVTGTSMRGGCRRDWDTRFFWQFFNLTLVFLYQ